MSVRMWWAKQPLWKKASVVLLTVLLDGGGVGPGGCCEPSVFSPLSFSANNDSQTCAAEIPQSPLTCNTVNPLEQ